MPIAKISAASFQGVEKEKEVGGDRGGGEGDESVC